MIITRSSKVHRAEITHWVRIITEVKKPNSNSKTNSCPADAALPHILVRAAPVPVRYMQLMEKAGQCSGCSTAFPGTAHNHSMVPGEPCQGSWAVVGSACLWISFFNMQIKVNWVKYQSPVSRLLAYIPKEKKKRKTKSKNRESIKGPLLLFFIRICYPEPWLQCQALLF